MPIQIFTAPSRKALLSVTSEQWLPIHRGSFARDGEEWYPLQPNMDAMLPHFAPALLHLQPWLVFDVVLGTSRIDYSVGSWARKQGLMYSSLVYKAAEWCEEVASTFTVQVHDINAHAPLCTEYIANPTTGNLIPVPNSVGCLFNGQIDPFFELTDEALIPCLDEFVDRSPADDSDTAVFWYKDMWDVYMRYSVGTCKRTCTIAEGYEAVDSFTRPLQYMFTDLAVNPVFKRRFDAWNEGSTSALLNDFLNNVDEEVAKWADIW